MNKRARWYRLTLPCAVLATALAGCGSSEDGNNDGSGAGTADTGGGDASVQTDAGEDATPDTTPDTTPDAAEDTTPDVGDDTTPDADAGTDTEPDVSATCGDGTVDPDEECDDSNNVDGDGCAADCTFEGGRNCDECVEDADCAGPALCYDAGDGATCAEPCEVADDCGGGYDCVELTNDADESLGFFCQATEACGFVPPVEICDDRIDNDGDGDADCTDADCALDPVCEGRAEICDDGIDNDGDGDVDCADLGCVLHPACPEVEVCNDGFDNDGDFDTDCDDADCAADPACTGASVCDAPQTAVGVGEYSGTIVAGTSTATSSCGGNGAEDVWAFEPATSGTFCASLLGGADWDTVIYTRSICDDQASELACEDDSPEGGVQGQVSFAADAGSLTYVFVDAFGSFGGGAYTLTLSEGGCLSSFETACNDGIDNDGDLLVDCDDDECSTASECIPEICDDGRDNDGDFDTDCFDDECTDDPYCGTFEWNCEDGVDQDGDSLIDCDDVDDCGDLIRCLPEVCDDRIDNNADRAVDCFDDDCVGDPYCDSFEWNCEDGVDNDGDSLIDCDDDECGFVAGCFDAPTCDAPTMIAIGDAFVGNLAGLTGAHSATCGGSANGPEAVYAFTADADGDVCFSTGGSTFDTVLHVRTGDCATGTQVACNDDSGLVFGTRSTVDLAAVSGTTYYVFVDTYGSGAGGLFNFRTYEGPCVLEFESSCGDGVDNEGDGAIDCEDTDCATSFSCGEICDDGVDNDFDGQIDCFDSECGETFFCTSTEWSCNDGVDQDGDLLIDCDDVDDCGDSPFCSPEICDDGVDNNANGAIDCFDPECTLDPYCGTIEWNCVDGVDNDEDSFIDCDDDECATAPTCLAGLACAEAGVIDGPGTYTGDTTSATNDFASDCGISEEANDEAWTFTPTADGTYCIDTLGTAFDTVLAIQAICGDSASELTCDDDSDFAVDFALQSEIEIELLAGETYTIIVDGFSFDEFGPYTLHVSEGNCDGLP